MVLSVCPAPLGMESGAILDSQISASSEWSSYHAAHLARLHLQAVDGNTGAWSCLVNDLNQWLQVDLGSKTRVARIATQGRADYNMWVILYMLQYSEDGQAFTFHRQNGDNSDTVPNLLAY